jgi:RNA recognition motif-containing protein
VSIVVSVFFNRLQLLCRSNQPIFGSREMAKKIYVGNLGFGVTDKELSAMFEPHGTIKTATVIVDRDTGRSKGFGFVEMTTDKEANDAIAALNGTEMEGRALTVNEARPKKDGGRSGSGGRGHGGSGGRRF